MSPVNADPVIEEYLRRLEAAAAGLPPQRRAELVTEIREHVGDALRAAGADDEATVRIVLARLGRPEEIAAAAGAPLPESHPRAGPLEITALIVLALIPVVGWLLGALLVLLSRAWSSRDQLVALLLPVVLVLWALVLGIALWRDGSSVVGPVEFALVPVLLFFGGPVVAFYLAWRLAAQRGAWRRV